MTNKRFTEEELMILRQNPFVLSATAAKITYSLEFKKFAVAKAEQGLTATQIFIQAGFDPEMLGKPRMTAAVKKFKKQAASPEGLQPPKGKTREERLAQFAKEDYGRRHTKVAIREMQKRILHLEQQIEFLKKIQFPEE